MNIKKCIASVIAAAFCLTMISGTASAHTGEYWQGKYSNDKQKDLCLVVNGSAHNSLFTNEVLSSGVSFWNNISGNVKVSVEFRDSSSTSDFINDFSHQKGWVEGANTSELKGAVGLTTPYDQNGNPLSSTEDLNKDWWVVDIQLNIDESAFDAAPEPDRAAKKTYIHEIGHALKLTHPKCDPSLDLHVYGDGYPLSVMNQGVPHSNAGGKGGATAEVPKHHDIINLKAKWGE